jgi:aminomethyltransferase
MEGTAKKTALYNQHKELGAKLVDFHGWIMPVQYEGILAEHRQVRGLAGLFDVSHMGEVILDGDEAEEALQSLVANNVKRLSDCQCLYTPMCYDNGSIIDDLLVYRLSHQKFMLVINASNTEKDLAWIRERIGTRVQVRDESLNLSLLALQGPLAASILSEALDYDLNALSPFHFAKCPWSGGELLISRTGYTGEDGFEIYLDSNLAPGVFGRLLENSKVKPVGLGARDTLRFEARLPLYGNELSDQVTPLDTGLRRFCDLDGDDFIGKTALIKQNLEKPQWVLRGLEMQDKGIPRTGFEVFSDQGCEEKLGAVTSGSHCPSLGTTCALALLKRKLGRIGSDVFVDIRGRVRRAKIVKTPFYKRKVD